MRGTADLHLLDEPVPTLLSEVTGLTPDRTGSFTMLKGARIKSTQRLALGEVGGGIVAFTWPAELQGQAAYLYEGARGSRLLSAATAGNWDVDMRPHLAFWRSSPDERLYTNPHPAMTVEQYVARWAGDDGHRIGAHDAHTIRNGLWPWLLEQGYATPQDEPELGPFLDRLEKRNRPAHLRPGLRLLRRWTREDVVVLRARAELAHEIRSLVNHLLRAVDDATLPAR